MGIKGLGKLSPVRLTLSRENYEALIERQGQWVRWLQGQKCTCILDTGRPNINCTNCQGDGWKYEFQKEITLFHQKAKIVSDWIVDLGCNPGEAIEALRLEGREIYTIDQLIDGEYVLFSGNSKPQKYEDLRAGYRKTLEMEKKSTCEYLGNNYFALTGNLYYQSEYGKVWGDITEVSSIKNETKDETYTVTNFFRNIIETQTPATDPDPDDVIIATIKYIYPFKFFILSQVHRKTEQEFLQEIGGDGFCTFPEEYKVIEGDAITLLIGNQTKKEIITRSSTIFDRIPEFYVSNIQVVETSAAQYEKNVDYKLFDRNRIKWIGSAPDAGTKMYVQFDFHPTYRVMREYPYVRSSENQRFPKRVAIKLFSAGGNVKEGI